MTVIMVALPVVFQPELRRALEQIGRGKLFHKGSELDEQELEEMLDSVAHATKVMSKNKVGALMVFERLPVWQSVSKPVCRLTVW